MISAALRGFRVGALALWRNVARALGIARPKARLRVIDIPKEEEHVPPTSPEWLALERERNRRLLSGELTTTIERALPMHALVAASITTTGGLNDHVILIEGIQQPSGRRRSISRRGRRCHFAPRIPSHRGRKSRSSATTRRH